MPKRGSASPPGTHRPFEALKAKARAGASRAPERRATPEASAVEARGEVELRVALRDVVPLPPRSSRVPRTSDAHPRTAPAEAVAAMAEPGAQEHPTAAGGSTDGFELVDDGQLLEGRRLDVDPRELGRLRRGAFPVDGQLDLHGHTLSSAREAVIAFVARRRAQGDRVVRLVHGKGKHSPRGSRVLRGELGAWLSQSEAARHVRAFASVDESPEPSSAVLVLLARR